MIDIQKKGIIPNADIKRTKRIVLLECFIFILGINKKAIRIPE